MSVWDNKISFLRQLSALSSQLSALSLQVIFYIHLSFIIYRQGPTMFNAFADV